MNKDNLIKVMLVSVIFIVGSAIALYFTEDLQKNVSLMAYWIQSLMYGIIGLIFGIKNFQNKISFHIKKSDVFLIVVLLIITIYPLYLTLLPYPVMSFLMTFNVNIVASLALGYLLGNLVN